MDRPTKLQLIYNEAEDKLLQAEIAFKRLLSIIEGIEREIGILTVVEGNLVANLNVLKHPNIIPMADLYKKTRDDLVTARRRLVTLRNDREYHLRIRDNALKTLEKTREEFQAVMNRYMNPESNVIQVEFGRREDGQE